MPYWMQRLLEELDEARRAQPPALEPAEELPF